MVFGSISRNIGLKPDEGVYVRGRESDLSALSRTFLCAILATNAGRRSSRLTAKVRAKIACMMLMASRMVKSVEPV